MAWGEFIKKLEIGNLGHTTQDGREIVEDALTQSCLELRGVSGWMGAYFAQSGESLGLIVSGRIRGQLSATKTCNS